MYFDIPDGYFPNGEARPWVTAKFVSLDGDYITCTRLDTGEQVICQEYAIRNRRNSIDG